VGVCNLIHEFMLKEGRIIGAKRRVSGDNDAAFPAESNELFLRACTAIKGKDMNMETRYRQVVRTDEARSG